MMSSSLRRAGLSILRSSSVPRSLSSSSSRSLSSLSSGARLPIASSDISARQWRNTPMQAAEQQPTGASANSMPTFTGVRSFHSSPSRLSGTHAQENKGSTIQRFIYENFFRRNSTYVFVILLASIGITYYYAEFWNTLWRWHNKGRLFDDVIPVKFSELEEGLGPDEDDDDDDDEEDEEEEEEDEDE